MKVRSQATQRVYVVLDQTPRYVICREEHLYDTGPEVFSHSEVDILPDEPVWKDVSVTLQCSHNDRAYPNDVLINQEAEVAAGAYKDFRFVKETLYRPSASARHLLFRFDEVHAFRIERLVS